MIAKKVRIMLRVSPVIRRSGQKCKTGKRHAINHALPGFAGLSEKEGKIGVFKHS